MTHQDEKLTNQEAVNLAAIAVDGIQLIKRIWVGVGSRDDLVRETANFIKGAARIARETEQAQRHRARSRFEAQDF